VRPERHPMSCPHCGKINDCHTATDQSDNKPVDGDCALCIGCGKWSIFDHESLRLPTMQEWATILGDPECIKTERAWRRMDYERARGFFNT